MSGIFINSDGWNFWGWGKKEDMNAAGIRRDVDFYAAQGGVEAVFYNLNYQCAFFPSKVLDNFLDGAENYPENGAGHSLRQAAENFRELMRNCPDFIRVRYQYCHERGLEMWHSMRMNDVHFTLEDNDRAVPLSNLWRQRKDLIRAWYRKNWRRDPQDMCLDYGQPEVRERNLALVREYLLDYESDGLELDWLRALPVFRPGYDENSTEILTDFMREVKSIANEAAKKWGHRIRLAARVPFRVDEAVGAGMDAATWCREGLIDILIPGPNNTGNEVDPQLSVWRMLTPKTVLLAPCIDYSIYAPGNYGTGPNEATDCGFASAFYQLGADSIYLYNHFPITERVLPQIRAFFGYAGDRRVVSAKTRRHVAPGHDPAGESRFIGPRHPLEIWPNHSNGGTKINAGEGNAGRQAEIIIGFTKNVEIDVLLNTVKCPLATDTENLPAGLPKCPYFVRATVLPGVLHDGWNAVEIYNRGTEIIYTDKELPWMEIIVKGK